ncbi:MAG TPA: M4 family metallopeptidase [Thermoanaerobaculia bacterium]|nr:M4 family metallopeptidase [Thermoanaerobaculia bacterium]
MIRRPAAVVVSALVLLALAFSGPSPAQTTQRPPARPEVAAAISRLAAAADSPVRTTISPTTGLVSHVGTSRSGALRGRVPASEPAETRARAFLDDFFLPAFGIASSSDLALVRDSRGPDEVGMEHVRFVQTHRGVPVTGGELTVHLRGADLVSILGKTLPDLEGIDVVPAVAPDEALATVEEMIERRFGVADPTLSEPRLELLNAGLLEGRAERTRLAWFVEAQGPELREYVWIDAQRGVRLLQFSQLTDARNRMVYDADSLDVALGTLRRSEGQGPYDDGAGGLDGGDDVNDAYDYSGDTYDYFFDEHGRDSYDDAGATLISRVRYCPTGDCPYANAFWDGSKMTYGQGFAAADDVAAHELTHAVTEYTANLFYYQQSGALNESFSDIFGEAVDLLNGSGDDTPGVRWLLGEDVPGFGAIRDMEDPTVFGDPGKLSDSTQFVCDPNFDAGGVHFNSGVPNRAFSLMVDGGTYNGETVSAIGLTKAGRIQYRTLAHYLSSSSNFTDNYDALNQSCQDLVGTAGITDADCTEVMQALDAVEMSDTWPCTAPITRVEPPPLCAPAEAPSIVYSQDFESDPLPACPSTGLPTAWCTEGPTSSLGPFATSGVKSAWGFNRPVVSEFSFSQTVPGALPANARLQFNHSTGFETTVGLPTFYWDGGQIQTSTNGGGIWSDAGGLITAGLGYGGTVDDCCGNPFGNELAFVAHSYGYTASQIDLSSFAGTNGFQFRFVVGTDSTFDDYGWFVDDVRVFTCAECAVDRVLDSSYSGTASSYKAANSIVAGDGFQVGLAEDVSFEAGDFVALQDGFSVNGGTFSVKVTPGLCD